MPPLPRTAPPAVAASLPPNHASASLIRPLSDAPRSDLGAAAPAGARGAPRTPGGGTCCAHYVFGSGALDGSGAIHRWTARALTALALLAAPLLGACDDDPKPPAGATAGASASTARAAAPAKSAAAPVDHVELQKFALTSGVKAKDPVDVLDAAKPGQRVYGHVTVRNRTSGAKRVTLSFRVNGDERTMVDLDIEKSWSWRSWAYVTLRKDDKGELTVHVFDDHGAELDTRTIPIR